MRGKMFCRESKIHGREWSFSFQRAGKGSGKIVRRRQDASFVCQRKALTAIIAVADTVKCSSEQAIEELHKMHIDVVMLTGDNKRTAQAVQKKLGISQVVAEVLPEDKEKEIRKLQNSGKKWL